MISKAKWQTYIQKLAAIDTKVAEMVQQYIEINGLENSQGLIDYAYGIVTKYGEASAELTSEMYDLMAESQGATVPPAEPADTATIDEVSRGVMYGKYHSPNQIPSIVGRQVRQAGADTMLKNAIRDQAEWAWIPSGDTCAFCITLASRGWQKASKKVLKGDHAEHIHANCDCTFGIAFNEKGKREYDSIYDPQKYEDMYYGADGNTPKERINSIRRTMYHNDPEYYRQQKNDAYHARKLGVLFKGKSNQDDINENVIKEDSRVIKRFSNDFEGNVPAPLVKGEKSSCSVFKTIDENHVRIEREIVNTELPSGDTNVDLGNPALANSIHERMHDIVNQILLKRAGLPDGFIINNEQKYIFEREKALFIQNAFIECFSEFDDEDEIYKTIESEISTRAMTPIEMFPESAVQYIGKKDYSVYAERLYNYVIKEWKK